MEKKVTAARLEGYFGSKGNLWDYKGAFSNKLLIGSEVRWP